MFSSIKSIVVLVALFGFVVAEVDLDGGRSGGGQSGEGRGCFIAPAGTTNCTGLTGSSCNNVTALTVSEKEITFEKKLAEIAFFA